MARRDEIPPFMDIERKSVKLVIGSVFALSGAAVILKMSGMTPLGIALAVGTVLCCLVIPWLPERLSRTKS